MARILYHPRGFPLGAVKEAREYIVVYQYNKTEPYGGKGPLAIAAGWGVW